MKRNSIRDTCSAVAARVISPWICTTPAIGAISCRSMATTHGGGAVSCDEASPADLVLISDTVELEEAAVPLVGTVGATAADINESVDAAAAVEDDEEEAAVEAYA